MPYRPNPRRLAGFAILAGLLAGCGTQATVPTATTPRLATTQQASQQQQDPLGLSKEQQQRLQAIAEKHRVSGLAADMDRIKQLLSAQQVDVPALTNQISQDRQNLLAKVPEMVSSLNETRQVFTDAQRAKFVQLIQQGAQEQQQQPEESPFGGLNLNAQQKQALDALKPKGNVADMAGAIAAFMQNGDQQAVANAITNSINQLPDASTIANALASLTPEQRQKLTQPPEEPQQGQQQR